MDRTFFVRVMTAIGIVMVHQLVHIASDHLPALKAERIHRGPVDKRAVALQIEPTNTFASRVQQRLPLLHLSLRLCSRRRHLANPIHLTVTSNPSTDEMHLSCPMNAPTTMRTTPIASFVRVDHKEHGRYT